MLLTKIKNLLFSAIYLVTSLSLFCFIQILFIVSPLIIGGGIWYIASQKHFEIYEYHSQQRAAKCKEMDPLVSISSSRCRGPILRSDLAALQGVMILSITGSGFFSIITLISFIKISKIAWSNSEERENKVEDPRIIKVVNNTVNLVGVSEFHEISFNLGINISTTYISNKRGLSLSLIALGYLTDKEIQAIIAHECAHHHHNAMLSNRIIYRVDYFLTSFIHTVKKLRETAADPYPLPFGAIGIFQIPVLINLVIRFLIIPIYLLAMKIFSLCLSFLQFLFHDSDYEYYCDTIAIDSLGSNIFSSALQKVFDLNLAHNLVSKEIDKVKLKIKNDFKESDYKTDLGSFLQGNSIEIAMEESGSAFPYVMKLNQEYMRLIKENPPERKIFAEKGSISHPSLINRLKRAEKSGNYQENSSTSLIELKEVQDMWKQRFQKKLFDEN